MRRGALTASLAVLALAMVAPFVIVALNAVKSKRDYTANGPFSLPEGLSSRRSPTSGSGSTSGRSCSTARSSAAASPCSRCCCRC
ncbi:hypothetical protein [Nonomuraea recticatena]|uniref:hypothetical protein n=1 Tax=Nonomuraea recticatena TaxID=46178 RepID=UPI003607584D